MLVGRMSVPAQLEAKFNQAYNTERLPRCYDVPGYIRGRRFEATKGEPKYTTLHRDAVPPGFRKLRVGGLANHRNSCLDWNGPASDDPRARLARSIPAHLSFLIGKRHGSSRIRWGGVSFCIIVVIPPE